jgi:WD40 repeat protein
MNMRTFQLAGEPVAVAESVATNPSLGRSAFALSANGVLAYRGGLAAQLSRLTWFGRGGDVLGRIAEPEDYLAVRLSPDGKTAAVIANSDVWTVNVSTGVAARATTGGKGSVILGPWSPDSQRLAVNYRSGAGLFELTVSSGKMRRLAPDGVYANAWSPDGSFLLGGVVDGTKWSLINLNDPKPQTIQTTPHQATNARLSPDGKFVAYTSDESGNLQVMIAAFPSFSEKRQVSVAGGSLAEWRSDGRELFFVAPDGTLMAAEIRTSGRIEASVPTPLFKLKARTLGSGYAPAPDGKRFLVIDREQGRELGHTMVVVNWTADLK